MSFNAPPIRGNPRRRREELSDAGIALRQPAKRARSSRLKVTVKNRALLEDLATHFGVSRSAVMNMGLVALAREQGLRD